jgi:hypothetical protein
MGFSLSKFRFGSLQLHDPTSAPHEFFRKIRAKILHQNFARSSRVNARVPNPCDFALFAPRLSDNVAPVEVCGAP